MVNCVSRVVQQVGRWFLRNQSLEYGVAHTARGVRYCARAQVRSMPIRKDDTVVVVRGSSKNKDGKVIDVYRKRYQIHIERLTRDRLEGACARLCAGGNCAWCAVVAVPFFVC